MPARPQAQNSKQVPGPQTPQPGAKNGTGSGDAAGTGSSAGKSGQQGGDSKSASGSASDGSPRQVASGKQTKLSPLDPAPPPPRAFARPRIGLALGGGGALALSEVGTLEWFEEHHIPVDVMAGTSMGCMVSALYSTGRSPEQLKSVMNDRVFTSVFSFSNAYVSRSFRRREDSREIPNSITIGLRHGVSFRNAVLTDQGLNAFLDRQFLRYDDQTDFNTMPIPLRCISTDLNEAKPVTFARGSVPDAVRASVSLPGVYQPFEMDGHEYVDGGVLENLPTRTVKDMGADVVLAVSLPLSPVGKGDLGSLLGVLGRSFSVAIEGAEREQRKLADVVIMPDLKGFGATDYLKTIDLAKRGYEAAEAQKAQLLPYALSDVDWAAYLAHRARLRRGPPGPVLRVRVSAPTESATLAIQRIFAPLVNQPVDTRRIETLLDQVRSDGRYDADYTVGYETPEQLAAQQHAQATQGVALPKGTVDVPVATRTEDVPEQKPTPQEPHAEDSTAVNATTSQAATAVPQEDKDETLVDRPGAHGLAATKELSNEALEDIAARPIVLISVMDKKSGPPFLQLGANVQAQGGGITRATVEGILLNQDFGAYGAELRTHIKLGYVTQLTTEYFRPFNLFATPGSTLFGLARGGLIRRQYPIYRNQLRVADRMDQTLSLGADVGWTNLRTQTVRGGYDYTHVNWYNLVGTDNLADVNGSQQRAHVHYEFDTQDRALVPQFGLHATADAAYLFSTVASEDTPQLTLTSSYAHRFRLKRELADGRPNPGHEIFLLAAEAGTMLNHNVAQPFRYTLGGPLRLTASGIDELRGTDYYLIEPALLRRIAQLPQPLGQSIYLGVGFEAGQMRAPDYANQTRQDVFFGLVAETPLGVVTLAPAFGTSGERKFTFTLGRLF